MTTTAGDQVDQLRNLKQSLLTALRFDTGFSSVQAETRRAFKKDLITNETQQAILEACQPLRLGFASDPTTSIKMVSTIETLIKLEVDKWKRVFNECS